MTWQGQPRPSLKDVGCDQDSVATAPHPPLTAFDVGPFWMQTRQTVVTWTLPDYSPYGRPLTASQLNANANTPGTFAYTPPLGTILNAGANQLLTVVFTPNDTVHYNSVTQSVRINIQKATPAVTWATPAPIIYGTTLSSTQLNATALIPGTFSYTPAPGDIAGWRSGSIAFSDLQARQTPTTTRRLPRVWPWMSCPPHLSSRGPIPPILPTAQR